jgi:CHAT domain-containing protein
MMSIYRDLRTAQRTGERLCPRLSRALVVALLLYLCPGAVIGGAAAPNSCSDMLGAVGPFFRQRVETHGTQAVQASVALPPGREWLIEVREQGNDALVEIRDAAGEIMAQADHPERRTGTRRAIVSTFGQAQSSEPAPSSLTAQVFTLRITGKEHDAVLGSAEIAVFNLAEAANQPICMRAFRALAAADAQYAIGQQISRGHRTTVSVTAHGAYQHAAESYLAAEVLLDHPGDAGGLRGEAALALASVRYYDLQDWRGSAEWAGAAEDLFGNHDAYRRARAQALAAAAWIEMANGDAALRDLFVRARRRLNQLYRFHAHRQEWYDAALQINNVGLADYYEGRFGDCVAAAGRASGLFARLGETPRQGLAWQNRALCFWGLGHLPEALGAFNRALKNLGPDPYPQLYVLTLNNTALMNFALGHFDESLRLLDRALALALRLQNRRAEAMSLYAIGVTYYGLGDRHQAQEFLERALAIRTAAFDGRGRRATLRSLATVYGDLGQYGQAIAFDREALVLASTPTPRALGRIQLALHTALAGESAEALNMLDELLVPGTVPDHLVRAQAQLERAVIERGRSDYEAALRDLKDAIPVFSYFGSVSDEFSAYLERARDLRSSGDTLGALAAVAAALKRSEAIRMQTANPEFRAQLQLPLRAAYDLKLDLLWEQFQAATKAGEKSEADRIAGEAFRAADAARARSFADIAAEQYTPALRRDMAGDLARRAMLDEHLAGLRFALDSRVDGSGSADPRAKALHGEIAGVERQLDTLNTEIATRAGAAARPLVPGAATVAMPQDAAIIAYWLGAQNAYCWTATPEGIHWARIQDSATITLAAQAFHDSLSRLADVPRERRLEDSQVLFGEIIRPVEQWIAPYKRWFIVPDAALSYVPVAALRADSGTNSPYVVMTHDVALAPAAWMLLAPRRSAGTPGTRLLLVSDPVYERSDPRLNPAHDVEAADDVGAAVTAFRSVASHPATNYQRIPGTAREATAIRAALPARDVDEFSGLDASRERLLQLDWSRYRFVHIASHGQIDAETPELSALMLSAYDKRGQRIEGALRTADLSTLTLNAEVAVFTGCDTALGKDVLNEGMAGIAYTALARGAGAVVSSLWQIPDEIGANLMTELYGHLIRDSMNPVTALNASLRSVLIRNPVADPALWAAFQVSVAGL